MKGGATGSKPYGYHRLGLFQHSKQSTLLDDQMEGNGLLQFAKRIDHPKCRLNPVKGMLELNVIFQHLGVDHFYGILA